MKMMYLNKNGVTEQVRFYRQEPRHMVNAPFDFQIDEHHRKKSLADTAVIITCVVCAVVLYAYVYSK